MSVNHTAHSLLHHKDSVIIKDVKIPVELRRKYPKVTQTIALYSIIKEKNWGKRPK